MEESCSSAYTVEDPERSGCSKVFPEDQAESYNSDPSEDDAESYHKYPSGNYSDSAEKDNEERCISDPPTQDNKGCCSFKPVVNADKRSEHSRKDAEDNIDSDLPDEEESSNSGYVGDVEATKLIITQNNFSKCMKVRYVDKSVFTCSECDKTFSRSTTLTRHIKRIHFRIRPHKCGQCTMCFTIASELKRHMQVHAGERFYKCTECAKSCATASDLKKHLRVHTGERPYSCSECQRTFSRSDSLCRHMRIAHIEDNPFKCNECKWFFASLFDLEKHMRVHTRERIHKCTECEKAFTSARYLKSHMRVHSGERPFCCSICDKTFSHSSNRNNHMRRVHLEEDRHSQLKIQTASIEQK